MVRILTEDTAEKFLKSFIPVVKGILTCNLKQAESYAKKLSYPLVLKIISKQALHKSDIKGVRIVNTRREFEENYIDLLDIAKKRKLKLKGIILQEYIKGKEVIIGINYDPTFRHVIMLGTGGTLVEVLKDITFRACPIDEKDAQSMIDDLKLKKVLYGVRGEKAVNINFLKQCLVKVSKIPLRYKNIKELDINPFIINEHYGKVADARIVFT